MQKGHRVSCVLLVVSDSYVLGRSKSIMRLRSEVARCIVQSVRHVGFLRNREVCITMVAWGEAIFVVK